MAKKARAQRGDARQRAQQRRRRQQLLLGGALLVVVLGVVAFVRYRQQSAVAVRLQGAVANHYTWGTPDAQVVVKEFFDYT